MPTIPNGLVPVVAAYSTGSPDGVVRTELAGGHSRTRLDWARGRQRFAVQLVMNASQMSAWTAFFHRIIKKGAIPFDMRLNTGLGVAPHQVNIVPGSYQVSAVSGTFSVSFVVECESAVYALSDAAVAAYALDPDRIPDGMVPVISQYSFGGPDGVARDGVNGGRAGYALQRDRETQLFTCTLMLTAPQLERWLVWFHRVLLKGARSFTMRLNSGMGPEDHRATIVPGSYSETRTGGVVTVVTFTVDAESPVYDLSLLDAEMIIDFHNGVGNSAGALLDRIERFATVDTNVLEP